MISTNKNHDHVSALVVGGGPAGLSAAIAVKNENKDIDVAVLEKGNAIGNHNLSGAVIEFQSLKCLLDTAKPDWHEIKGAENLFSRKVNSDDVWFFWGKKHFINLTPVIKISKQLRMSFGGMDNYGNLIVSISELTRFLSEVALALGVEIYTGFGVKEIIYDKTSKRAGGAALVDQGVDKEGRKQSNYVKGDEIKADIIILAEGASGLATEDFVIKAGLKREINQVFSVGVKQIIKVSEDNYRHFGENRALHTMGYPLWSPIVGPGIFGGGFAYSYGKDQIAIGIIAGADWEYYNFNPQKALEEYKNHSYIKQFIEGGEVIEDGVKIIPEGGYYAIPRYHQLSPDGKATNTIGYNNVLIVGDSAGLVNMHKMKGMHLAVESGMFAGKAAAQCIGRPNNAARVYTKLLDQSQVMKEMKSAKNFRSIIARFGQITGPLFSMIGKFLPKIDIGKDSKSMKETKFKYDNDDAYDKATFASLAGVEHREDQPSHLSIIDNNVCNNECEPRFERPCIGFCPAGVYDIINGETVPVNPSNCLHCKTCLIKCPYDNIGWTVPEGGGGPKYKFM